MKIAILHHDLEPSEELIKKSLEQRDFSVKMINIKEAKIDDFQGINIVLNRVYASVANRDFKSIIKTLLLLKKLEEQGIYCINSFATSVYDYSKFDSYKIMRGNNLPTPKTLLIKSKKEINGFSKLVLKELTFPMIIKRNTGGRGKDISKVDSKEKLKKELLKKFESAKEENYLGGFVVQEFIRSVFPHDFRVSIVNKKIIYSMSRTFICDDKKNEKWLASMTRGSTAKIVKLSKEIEEVSLKATEAIGAFFNDVDIIIGKKGPYIIENNPTPNFAKRKVKSNKEKVVIEKVVNELISTEKCKPQARL